MKEETRLKAEEGIHEIFLLSILGKGLFAALQILLGVLLLFTNEIVDAVIQLVHYELVEDPSDILPAWAQILLHPSKEAQIFGALYLLSHGIVKIFLVAGLLRNKLWAYPASIFVFTLFIVYQMQRYFLHSRSIWLLVLTVVDIVVIWLIYHEYRHIKSRATIS